MIRVGDTNLTDEQVERVINTPIFRRALAYKRLADGVEALKEDDEMFDQLARDVNAEAGGRTKVQTTKNTLNAFVEVVNRYTTLVDDGDGDAPDTGDLDDLFVDEAEDENGGDA